MNNRSTVNPRVAILAVAAAKSDSLTEAVDLDTTGLIPNIIRIMDCPFCGATHASLDKEHGKGVYVYMDAPSSDVHPWSRVACFECGASTPSVKAWNNRPNMPPTSGPYAFITPEDMRRSADICAKVAYDPLNAGITASTLLAASRILSNTSLRPCVASNQLTAK